MARPAPSAAQLGKQPGGPGEGVLLVNGRKVGEGHIDRTVPMSFSLDDGVDVGKDLGTPVTEEYDQYDNQFNGAIRKVTIELTPGTGKATAEQQKEERSTAFARWLLD